MAAVAAATAVSCFAGFLLSRNLDWRIVAVAVIGVSFALTGLARPALFVSLFLLIRPLLDGFTEAGSSLSVSAGLGAGLLAVAAVIFLVRGFVATRIAKCLGLILLASVFAGIHALLKYESLVGTLPIAELARLAALAAVYLLATTVTTSAARARSLFLVVAVSGLVPAIVGVVQWVQGAPVAADLTIGRISGTFSGPNAFGEFLAIDALLLLALPAEALSRRVRIAVLVPVLIALVGTFSRSGWTLLLLGVLFLGWREHRRLVVTTVVSVAILASAIPSVRGRLWGNEQLRTKTERVEHKIPSSFAWRVENWEALLHKYRESPAIGFGLRTVPFVNPRQVTVAGLPTGGYDAHNTIVKLLLEGGPVLVVLWVAFFGMILARFRRLAREPWPLRRYARIVLALWAAVAVVGLTSDDPLAATSLLFALLTITAAVEGAAVYDRAED